MKKREVVITGMGVVSPNGVGVSRFKQNIFNGVSGISRIERFDPSLFPTQIAGEVKNLDVPEWFRDIKINFAQVSAREAMEMAFQGQKDFSHEKVFLSIGLGLELFSMPDLIKINNGKVPEFKTVLDKMMFLSTPADLCLNVLAREFIFSMPPEVHLSACVASTDAIGSGMEAIQFGDADIVLAGGADSMINPMGLGGFCALGALSKHNQDPAKASRPFDKDRDGFVLGEGAGFLVLEEKEHAIRRGAKILAAVCGFGNSLDAYSVSDPHPNGDGALLAMTKALESSGLKLEDISAVSAHGTSTLKNDKMETNALSRFFGERVMEVPVFALKSMIGHLISAGGAVESIASILCLMGQRIHPTINQQNVAEDCRLHHVQESREMKLNYILKSSFAFGGHNSCLIIGEANAER